MKRRYRVNYKRVITNIIVLAVIFLVFNAFTNITFGSRNIQTKTIRVDRNETLWSIASDICKASTEELNVQNVIIQIKNINNLTESTIYYGQELNVPIYM